MAETLSLSDLQMFFIYWFGFSHQCLHTLIFLAGLLDDKLDTYSWVALLCSERDNDFQAVSLPFHHILDLQRA